MIKFFLLVNKIGQTRMAKYYEFMEMNERVLLEGECVRKCLGVKDTSSNVVELRQYKLVFRRYASLYFIAGLDINGDDNEMAVYEFIHCYVETLNSIIGNICELDIMYNLDRCHFILDEMLANGEVVDVNKQNITRPLTLMEKARNKC
ncbi:uncharacterized protein [Blastocystis hominis]|uniref:AP complex subunit sigma n=1 Tax=Blastocystis hominis TaxID=12968 RepID=D8LWI4_BLAHO|nr:uncharacterized protein [Blastocystis hominis]CBK20173.2 unnamed protein product [Blastocystis hominis]|eukprot:XP_012894221.1 uncharacterized protein [Blastocystis hominis]